MLINRQGENTVVENLETHILLERTFKAVQREPVTGIHVYVQIRQRQQTALASGDHNTNKHVPGVRQGSMG
jgi:hypothetical protein